jgi:hypothetical protein
MNRQHAGMMLHQSGVRTHTKLEVQGRSILPYLALSQIWTSFAQLLTCC